MPMLTTSVIGLPVWPVQLPSRTASENSRMCFSTAATSGSTFSPSTVTEPVSSARSAVCSTARCSVPLIRSPANMRSRQPSTSCWRARAKRRPSVSSVTRFLE